MSTPSPRTEFIRPMQEADLVEARRTFRVAFGTFMGVPDPEAFWADREYIFTRWRADPGAALVAEVKGTLAGSNFATNWGSFGFFGPLLRRGFRTDIQGIAMHKPDSPAYDRPDVFAVDDWC